MNDKKFQFLYFKHKIEKIKMLYDNDTFLNYERFLKLRNSIEQVILLSKKRPMEKRMKYLSNELSYISTFKMQGEQGIVGLLKNKEMDEKIVYKISPYYDRIIEHESYILNNLNELRRWTSHFVGYLNMIPLQVSNSYISQETKTKKEKKEDEKKKKEKKDLYYTGKDDWMPLNGLLIEYVSNMSLYHICKMQRISTVKEDIKYSKNLLWSLTFMTLCALRIGQEKVGFCHYDLHIENILIRQCDPREIWVYKFGEKTYMIPTYGYYPVIIDMGCSYIKNYEDKNIRTKMNNYNNGLQSNIYDELNDIHHFIISMLYEVEHENDEFYNMSNLIMHQFRWIQIVRKNGWKRLPHNILKNFYKKMVDVLPVLKTSKTFIEIGKTLLETVCMSIGVKWKRLKEEDIQIMVEIIDKVKIGNINKELKGNELLDDILRISSENFIKEMEVIDNWKDIAFEEDIMFLLRELVEIIWDRKQGIIAKGILAEIQAAKNVWLNKIKILFESLPKKLNFERLYISIYLLSRLMEHYFYVKIIDHVDIINNGYNQINIKNIFDMIKFIRQNISYKVDINNDSIFRIMDVMNEKQVIKKVSEMDQKPPEDLQGIRLEKWYIENMIN